jgi:hypothetical protein
MAKSTLKRIPKPIAAQSRNTSEQDRGIGAGRFSGGRKITYFSGIASSLACVAEAIVLRRLLEPPRRHKPATLSAAVGGRDLRADRRAIPDARASTSLPHLRRTPDSHVQACDAARAAYRIVAAAMDFGPATGDREEAGPAMGILRGRRDDGDVRRFQMRQKLASIGDDFWIEDEQGNRAYRVDGKALRARETFVLEDPSGREVGGGDDERAQRGRAEPESKESGKPMPPTQEEPGDHHAGRDVHQ